MELTARTNRGRASSDGPETHFVAVSFRAPTIESRNVRLPMDLALVLDRSGSMNGRKLVLARNAVEAGIDLLRDTDRFALVVFDHEVDVINACARAGEEARQEARSRLRAVTSRGDTDLGAGWTRGAAELEAGRTDRVSRVVVATDGQANRGMTEPEEFFRVARTLREKGISTSTIGIGAGFREELLQGMADHGGGNSYFAETAEQLRDILAGELGESLEVSLRSPVLEVRVPRGLSASLLDRFPVTPRGHEGFDVSFGDLTSGQHVQVVIEVVLPAGRIGETLALDFALHGGEPRTLLATTQAGWTFCSPVEAAAESRRADVESSAARRLMARIDEDALRENRAGRYEGSQRVLGGLRERLAPLDPANEAVREIAGGLSSEVAALSGVMAEADMKRRFYRDARLSRGRDESGRAKKDS